MRAAAAIAGLALLLLVAALVYQCRHDARGPVRIPPLPEPAATSAPAPPEPQPPPPSPAPAIPPGVAVIGSGESLSIARADLPRGEPLRLALRLGDPAAGAAPLAARISGEGRGPVDLTESLAGSGAGFAEVAIDPTWLLPGRYIIEVKTTEQSHLPLRRYALEIR